jgi:hypothetical protein
MPIILGNPVNAGYTVVTTAGTYTLNPGPSATSPGGAPGAYYGAYVTTFGTSPVFTAYDIVAAHGTVAVATNLIANGTGTAVNQSFQPLSGGLPAVRYNGALLIVVTGTANAINILWD